MSSLFFGCFNAIYNNESIRMLSNIICVSFGSISTNFDPIYLIRSNIYKYVFDVGFNT